MSCELTPQNKTATAFAPATSANLSCGFDILGLALEGLGDYVAAELLDPGCPVNVISITGDPGKLSCDPTQNTAAIAVTSLLQRTSCSNGISLSIKKGLPLGSGLGSSAASAVAALVAVNSLLETSASMSTLLECALDAEEAACGSRHADNVAPCLLGGLTLVSSFNPLKVQKLPVPENFHCVLFTPKIEVSTKSARQALPSTVPFSIAVKQAQRAAAFVDACYRNNSSDALTNMIDLLAEPARKAFIPHFDILKSAAIDAGALSFGISGSGSTLIACTASTEAACHIEAALSEVYAKMDLAYSSLRSRPCQLGARLVDSGVTL